MWQLDIQRDSHRLQHAGLNLLRNHELTFGLSVLVGFGARSFIYMCKRLHINAEARYSRAPGSHYIFEMWALHGIQLAESGRTFALIPDRMDFHPQTYAHPDFQQPFPQCDGQDVRGIYLSEDGACSSPAGKPCMCSGAGSVFSIVAAGGTMEGAGRNSPSRRNWRNDGLPSPLPDAAASFHVRPGTLDFSRQLPAGEKAAPAKLIRLH